MDILVMGAGLVGAPMAFDLAKDDDFNVGVADINEAALDIFRGKEGITAVNADLSKPENVMSLVSDFDLVINALPGFMGYGALKTVIEAGRNVVDIAFFPEDPFALNDLAVERGVVAVVDCGLAPGMSNVLVGYAHSRLDETEDVLILVGGLPQERMWPFEYRAVFSPIDVIEEYTRPARVVEHGRVVVKKALSEREYVNFDGIGTLEAFNSDGLRTLIRTIDARNMKEKTLRFPGHAEKMEMLREVGFFSREEIEINGMKVRPIDFTAKLLFSIWKLRKGDSDFTAMRVVVEGRKGNGKYRYTFELFDRSDAAGVHSMARTTGYTATVTARMIAEGRFKRVGISPPEFIGSRHDCVKYLFDGLKKRGVVYRERVEEIE